MHVYECVQSLWCKGFLVQKACLCCTVQNRMLAYMLAVAVRKLGETSGVRMCNGLTVLKTSGVKELVA